MAGAVQMQAIGDLRQLDERVPGEVVHRLGVDAVAVGHHQVDVIAARVHGAVDQQSLRDRRIDAL